MGVFAIVVVVAVVLGIKVAWADSGVSRPEPAPSVLLNKATPDPSGIEEPGAPSASVGSPDVVVDVVGQVAQPGIVRLPAGSRVIDAVTAAGGPVPGADTARVNLARVVVDGEQIRIPAPGEELPAAAAAGGAVSSGGDPAAGTLVNLNTADEAALDSLPGVGPVLAGRILQWRATHGRFTSIDELGEVSGIGERLLEQLRPQVTL